MVIRDLVDRLIQNGHLTVMQGVAYRDMVSGLPNTEIDPLLTTRLHSTSPVVCIPSASERIGFYQNES